MDVASLEVSLELSRFLFVDLSGVLLCAQTRWHILLIQDPVVVGSKLRIIVVHDRKGTGAARAGADAAHRQRLVSPARVAAEQRVTLCHGLNSPPVRVEAHRVRGSQ